MVHAYLQDVPIDETLYRRIVDEIGPEPLAGSLLHLCVRRQGGGLRYLDVWESEQACARAFDERIHPAVDRAFGGNRPDGEPTVDRLEVLHASGALLGDTEGSLAGPSIDTEGSLAGPSIDTEGSLAGPSSGRHR